MAKWWTTKDGRQIKFKDMETGHLLNTIKMLENNVPKYREQIAERHEYDMDSLFYLFVLTDREILEKFTQYDGLIAEYNQREDGIKFKPSNSNFESEWWVT